MTNLPEIFPQDLTGMKKKFNLNHKDYFIYKNKQGEGLFVFYINENLKRDQLGRKKVAQLGAYSNGKWIEENPWFKIPDWKRPLYNLDKLAETKKDILVVAGNNTALAAEKLFPNYFVTTFYGDPINWQKVDWSILKNRKVFLLPNVQKDTLKDVLQFEALCLYLQKEHSCQAEMCGVPCYDDVVTLIEKGGSKYTKNNWDINDQIWRGFDPNKFIEESYIVTQSVDEDTTYSSIKDDYEANRYIYQVEGDCFFDTFKNGYRKDKQIDRLYERDEELRSIKLTGSKFLHRLNCTTVDGASFAAGKPFIYKKGNLIFLNRYKPPLIRDAKYRHKGDSILESVQFFKDHILYMLCDGDIDAARVIESAIAWDLQNVGGNRRWMILLTSEEGLGKDLFYKILKKLYGESNCEDLMLEDVTERFRPWYVEACYLFFGEVDDAVIKNKKLKGSFKRLISDNTFRVECFKGIDSMRIESCYTIWGSSNEPIPIRASKNQRRYYMVDSTVLPKDVTAKDPKYFDKLATFQNEDKIEDLYYYYKYIFINISNFNSNVCPHSNTLEEIQEASRAEYFRYIDRIVREVPHEIPSLKYDLINVNKFTEELQKYSFEDDAWGGKAHKLDYHKVLRWVKQNPNKKVTKQVRLIPGSEREGHLWCIRHHKDWLNLMREGIQELNTAIDAHSDGILKFGLQQAIDQKQKKEVY